MPDLDRRVLELLDLVHDAPGNREAWPRYLDALRDAISPDAVVVFVAGPNPDRPGVVAGSGLALREVPLGDFLRPSVPHPRAEDLPLGAARDLPARPFEESAVFREVLRPAGIRAGPGLVVAVAREGRFVTAAVLVLPRTGPWQPTAQDRALLQRLAPHLVIAHRLHAHLAEGRRETEALLSAFDHLVLGVVLLSAGGDVSYVNQSAAESLGLAPGFGGAETGGDAPDERTRAWRRLAGAEHDWSRSSIVLAHPGDGRALQLVAAPFGWSDRGGPLGRRFARAVFIGDPKRRTGDPIGVLNEAYGLTPGETRLTLLLLADCSLEEAAGLLEISRSTARSVLKRIFEKTGTNRQSALVRLLLTGFAQVRPGTQRDDPAPAGPLLRASGRR
jgi:DNA-binding CsgD family transcriptional regulator